jgi:ribosomal protein S3
MNDWKSEAGVDTSILWKHDYKRNKICLYTTKPGYFIGLNGTRYQKFHTILKEEFPNDQLIQNGIDIIECEDGI